MMESGGLRAWFRRLLAEEPHAEDEWDPWEVLGIPRGEPMDSYMVDDERLIRAAFGDKRPPRKPRQSA